MALTQQEIALQMIAQLRVLDPSVSAELGSPERKIIDTVAQALTDAQIDLVALRGALDLDSKFGDALDRFLALFGFQRRRATFSTGFVTFSRLTPSNNDIRIPVGTQVLANVPSTIHDGFEKVAFSTTFDVTLPTGDLSVSVPVRSNIAGAGANVAAGTITQFVGSPVLGITSITNPVALTGGLNIESDEEFKVRFKNQVFRNLAGTKDQYLALAAALAYTTKANVVGPISRYREYIQVPTVDDATYLSYGGTPTAVGQAGEFTSALSDVPYSKYIYREVPYFIANEGAEFFYRPDVDFRMNTTSASKDYGDTNREAATTPQIGYSVSDSRAAYQPNVTFLNVYTGIDPDIQAVRPGDIVLFEHSYLSTASRNDVVNGITNAVDVYIDGSYEELVSNITTRPPSSFLFVNDATTKYHYENYRRKGEPEHRPLIGNVLFPLFWQPVIDLPDQIVVNDVSYLKGIHYWVIEDISTLYGTIRARNGIEFSTTVRGIASGDDEEAAPGTWTGPYITAHASGTPVPVEDYTYDRNVADLQASLDANRQVTTDVLAHKAKTRYFKFDVTVMYTPGSSRTGVNNQIQQSVNALLRSAYFGQVIQLSDVLQAIHDVPGVDNVRWSSDTPGGSDLARVYEVDVSGNRLTNFIFDRTRPGATGVSERWQGYFTGSPTGGDLVVAFGASSNTVAYNVSAAAMQTALRAVTGNSSLTVTGSGTSVSPFLIDWITTGPVGTPLAVSSVNLTGGDKIFMADFFLKDDELPALPDGAITGDTAPGLILRQRAQNTFTTK
jgi:uncharacterized phage protein gp47/JayE